MSSEPLAGRTIKVIQINTKEGFAVGVRVAAERVLRWVYCRDLIELRAVLETSELPAGWSFDETACTLRLLRAPGAAIDGFFAQETCGLIVAEELRDLIPLIPLADREISEYCLAHLLVYRALPSGVPFCGSATRLRPYELLELGLARHTEEVRIVRSAQRTPAGVRHRSWPALLDELEACLSTAVQRCIAMSQSAPALLFSGGVDSSLLATFSGEAGLPLIAGYPEYVEYEEERAYAQAAARLLGRPLLSEAVSVEQLRSLFSETTADTLMPVTHTQSLLVAHIMRQHGGAFLTGDRADSLFGVRLAALGDLAASPLAQFAATRVGAAVGNWFPKISTLGRMRAALQRPVTAADGYAARFCRLASPTLLSMLVGESRLEEFAHDQFSWTQKILPAEEECDDHVTIGQFAFYAFEDFASHWAALGRVSGATILTPFRDPELVRLAFSVPRRQRYVNRGVHKALLKDLLSQRLPGYDKALPKLASVLPLRHIVQDVGGVLSNVDGAFDDVTAVVDAATSLEEAAEVKWAAIVRERWVRAIRETAFTVPAPLHADPGRTRR